MSNVPIMTKVQRLQVTSQPSPTLVRTPGKLPSIHEYPITSTKVTWGACQQPNGAQRPEATYPCHEDAHEMLWWGVETQEDYDEQEGS